MRTSLDLDSFRGARPSLDSSSSSAQAPRELKFRSWRCAPLAHCAAVTLMERIGPDCDAVVVGGR